MDNEIIYEMNDNITPFSLPFIFICLAFIVTVIILFKAWKEPGVAGKSFILVPSIILIVIIAQFVTFFQTTQVVNRFKNCESEIVEGTIHNYEEHYEVGTMSEEDYPDRFFVDNTEFVVYGYQTYGIEYYLRKSDGSILENGQKVKIYYTQFKYTNLILRIELVDS